MSTQAYYDNLDAAKQALAEDLDVDQQVIEAYLGNVLPKTKIYIGGGEILPCWPMSSEAEMLLVETN